MLTLTTLDWGGRALPGLVADGPVAAAAATTTYWQAEVFAVVWAAGILPILFHLLTHPALLRRRVRGGLLAEPESSQKLIASLLVLCVLALFAVSALDLLSGWSHVPIPVALVGEVLVAGGLVLLNVVFRVNEFAAAAVQVEPGQTVISTGPYALVRHPMYSAGLLMFLGAPVALGSWWGLILFPLVLLLIVVRLLDEERYLSTHLQGYRNYCAKVTHRLIPSIW